MKQKFKVLFTVALVLLMLVALAGCKGAEDQYAINDENGYTVSVQYHTGSGQFAAGTYVLTDCYNVEGKTELMLLDPNDPARSEPKQAQNNGYFLAGWYTERTDTGKTDENGNPVYNYSGYWDFETDTVKLESGKSYSSAEPVLNLYAAWVPNFSFEILDLHTGETVDTVPIDPTDEEELELTLSTWDESTGRLSKKDIPVKDGCTFNGLYLDAEGTQKVTEASVRHSGNLDLETAVATDPVMKLYVDYMEGSFVAVYTAEDLLEKLSSGKDVIIMNDLDFTDVEWSADVSDFSYGGKILGNGHKLSNITLNIAPQNVNSQEILYAGLFGMLEETAVIRDLTFENVKVAVSEGKQGLGAGDYFNNISIGLLTGQVTEGAELKDLVFTNCTIELDVTIENYEYTLGLVAASGAADLDSTGITVVLTGEGSEELMPELAEGLVKLVPAVTEEETEEAA